MMRHPLFFCLATLLCSVGSPSCAESKTEPTPPTEPVASTTVSVPKQAHSPNSMLSPIYVQIGTYTFELTLADTPATKALLEQLPLTLNMSELNGNEKYVDLGKSLPTSPRQVGVVHRGDLMLFQNRTLVLFYETFNTSYTYTPIGKISDASALVRAVGSGSISVTLTTHRAE